MKNISIILLLLICNFSQEKALNKHVSYIKSFQDSLNIKAKILDKLYILSTSTNSEYKNVYRQQFFDKFPNTFNELNELYGYDFKTHKAAPLYYEVEDHIYKLFNNLNNIDKVTYYKKIVSISIGGHWDADAINIFQEGLREKVLIDPTLIVDVLKVMPDNDVKSFWYFYFDGPVVDKQISIRLQKIKIIDEKIYNLMMEAHKEALNRPK